MIVIGLTGSVGMGKSTTAALFAAEGVQVFDADAVVHRLYKSDAVAPVEAAFPDVTRKGVIDREALAAKVVGDPDAMRRLEAIVHPLVRRERESFLANARAGGAAAAVLDIPLLFETGAECEIDASVVVSAAEPVQKARVMARLGMTEARFDAILRNQMPDDEKRRRATFVIETDQGLDHAARQVRHVLAALGVTRADCA